MEEILSTYINLEYGYEISRDKKNKIRNTIGYLLDNNYSKEFIIDYLLKNKTELIDELWENSLLKPNTFYYHSQLRIMSPCVIWNIFQQEKAEKFYLEMRINYTIDDLLNYFYNSFRVPLELRDIKRDSGSLNYMLNRNYMKNIESIDFVLALIDYNKNEIEDNKKDIQIINPLQLEYQKETYNKFQYVIDNSINNKIIWREYNV